MSNDRLAQILEKINKDSGKFYDFLEEHNPRIPTDYWFQYPPIGLTLFLVLYTRSCRWGRCVGCNLSSRESQFHVPYYDIMRQVDYIFDFLLSREQKEDLRKIILSNNGSVLDEETFSTTALLYFVAKMNMACPNVSILTLETRPEYVDLAELEVLHRALQEGEIPTNLELAIGFEAFSDQIRNESFDKGMSLEVFESMVKKLSKYGFDLKTYFMLKPVPGLTEEDAVEDITKGIDYLDEIARQYKININMHLNPTYVARGTILETEFNKGNYIPPRLESVRQAVIASQGKQISLYVGLNDEGLAVPGGSFIREGDKELLDKLHRYNHSHNYDELK